MDQASRPTGQYTHCRKCDTYFTGILREKCPSCDSLDVEWEFSEVPNQMFDDTLPTDEDNNGKVGDYK